MTMESPRVETYREAEAVELSEGEKRLVEEIERLPSTDSGKTDLILSWRGLKPATDFRVVLWDARNEGLGRRDENGARRQTVSLFRSLGLNFREDTESPTQTTYEYADTGEKKIWADELLFYVSRDEKLMNELSRAYKADEQDYYDRLGKMFGFPETAIEAYGACLRNAGGEECRKISIEHEELPEEIRKKEFMAFAQFRLSREHWQEELEIARRWAEEIKKTDPALHERVTNDYKNNLEKELLWNKTSANVEAIADRLGKKIDANVKEAVIAFLVNNFPTYQSCEGHVEGRSGKIRKIGPYISVGVDEPEPRFVGEDDIRRQIASQFNISPDQITENEVAERAYWHYIQEHSMEETTEYKRVRQKNEELEKRFSDLLAEFRKENNIKSPRLGIKHIGPAGHFSVRSVEEDLEEIVQDETHKYQEQLASEQAEMRALTKFLKERFLKG